MYRLRARPSAPPFACPLAVDIEAHTEALVLIAEGREPTGEDEVFAEHLARAELRARDLRHWRVPAVVEKAPPPIALLKSADPSIVLPASLERLIDPTHQAVMSKAIARVEREPGDPFLYDYWPIAAFEEAPAPFDPGRTSARHGARTSTQFEGVEARTAPRRSAASQALCAGVRGSVRGDATWTSHGYGEDRA